jgi:hypothetical protein
VPKRIERIVSGVPASTDFAPQAPGRRYRTDNFNDHALVYAGLRAFRFHRRSAQVGNGAGSRQCLTTSRAGWVEKTSTDTSMVTLTRLFIQLFFDLFRKLGVPM